jgi:hypothetical protein
VADVEAAVGGRGALELGVDGAGDDVARRQRASRVVGIHEGPPLAVDQHGALAAYRLADEEVLGLGVVEAGGVELDELHVGDGRPRTPSYGHAVAGGDVGVAGVEVDLAAAAGGEDGEAGAHREDALVARPQDVAADAAVRAGDTQTRRGHEVDQPRVLHDADIGRLLRLLQQGHLDMLAGDVPRMEHTALAVPALAS